LSTTEDVAAIGLTWFATHHPVIAASIALICLAVAIAAARTLLRAIQGPLRKLFGTELEANKASAKHLR
jgi:hypothetical protein